MSKKNIRVIIEYAEVERDDDSVLAKNVRFILEEDDEELVKKVFENCGASHSNLLLESILDEIKEFVERDFEDGSEGDVEVGDEVDEDPGE